MKRTGNCFEHELYTCPSGMSTKYGQRRIEIQVTELPVELKVVHPSVTLLAPGCVCLLPLRKEINDRLSIFGAAVISLH